MITVDRICLVNCVLLMSVPPLHECVKPRHDVE
jgi:hypothetical protein